jgi:Lon protease-like protein
MGAAFVLPLLPLDSAVLLPGQRIDLGHVRGLTGAVVERAQQFGSTLVASLRDGDSVHDIGVAALVSEDRERGLELRGVSRCRLLAIRTDDVPIVTAERFPEAATTGERSQSTARLLRARYLHMCRTFGREPHLHGRSEELSALTLTVAADLGLAAEQQQGFLVVPDAFTRGRLLLAAMRELELKERFLRPWARLRSVSQWN